MCRILHFKDRPCNGLRGQFSSRDYLLHLCVSSLVQSVWSKAPNACLHLNMGVLASHRLWPRLVRVRTEAAQAPIWPGGNIGGEETELWHSEEELWLALREGCKLLSFLGYNRHVSFRPLPLFLILACAHFDGPSGKVVKEQSQSSGRWPGVTLQGGSAENEQLGYNDSSASQPGKKKKNFAPNVCQTQPICYTQMCSG